MWTRWNGRRYSRKKRYVAARAASESKAVLAASFGLSGSNAGISGEKCSARAGRSYFTVPDRRARGSGQSRRLPDIERCATRGCLLAAVDQHGSGVIGEFRSVREVPYVVDQCLHAGM